MRNLNLESDPGSHRWREFVIGRCWEGKCQGSLKHWKLDPILHFCMGELKETIFHLWQYLWAVCVLIFSRQDLAPAGKAALTKGEPLIPCRHTFHWKGNPEVLISMLSRTLCCLMPQKLSLVMNCEAEPGSSQRDRPHTVSPSEQEIHAWPFNTWIMVFGVSDMWTMLLLGLCPYRTAI